MFKNYHVYSGMKMALASSFYNLSLEYPTHACLLDFSQMYFSIGTMSMIYIHWLSFLGRILLTSAFMKSRILVLELIFFYSMHFLEQNSLKEKATEIFLYHKCCLQKSLPTFNVSIDLSPIYDGSQSLREYWLVTSIQS